MTKKEQRYQNRMSVTPVYSSQSVTEDYIVYMDYVYELAIRAGFESMDAQNLSEMALYKKIYQGIQYSEKHEKILRLILSTNYSCGNIIKPHITMKNTAV